MICQVLLVTEIVKNMHFSASTFQGQKLLSQIRKLFFFAFIGSLKFVNLQFKFYIF